MRFVSTAVSVLTAALTAGAPTTASAAPPGPGADPTIDVIGLEFQVVSALGDRCLTASGALRPCAPSHRWRLRPVVSGGGFQFVDAATGTCLTAAGGVAACDDHPARRWLLRDQPGDYAQVVNAQTGRCLTAAGATSGPDTCAEHPSRRWTVRLLSLPLPFVGGAAR